MYFVRGRPRFWIPAYDRIHLAVPALLGLVAVLLATAPAPVMQPVVSAAASRPPQPSVSVIILSPISGASLEARQLARIEGVATPGVTVSLHWFDRPLGQPTHVGADGRWSFLADRFPPGQHLLRAVAHGQGGQATSAPTVFHLQATRSPITGPTRRKGTR